MVKDSVKTLALVVDDGSVKVPILNTQGDEIGLFYFRPTDLGIINRFNQVIGEFDKVTEPLENVDINADGTVDEKDALQQAAMQEAERRLYEACNYLFGGNFAEAFFGKMHPFSPIGGRFYCENALESVGNFISQQFEQEVSHVNNRVEKYTHSYRTGGHKKGGKRKGGKK